MSISDPNGTGALDGANPLNGILGSILGETQEAQKARLEEASKSANDLTSLVKRRKPVKTEEQLGDDESVLKNHGKRKVDLAEEVEEAETAKKAKMEDV